MALDTRRAQSPLGAVPGHLLAGLTRFGAVVRPAVKPLHPHGNVLAAELDRVGVRPPTGVPWLDEPGTDAVVVRLSRAVGLPRPVPDIFGLALRVPIGEEHGDLLFASTGLGRLGRFILRPSRTPFDRPMTTLLPYRTDQGPVTLAAVGTSRDAFDILCAIGTRPWRRLGTLRLLADGSDAMVSFDPLLNTVPGVDNYRFVEALREPAYRAARRSRRCADPGSYGAPMSAQRWVVDLERAWDRARLRRTGSRPPAHFRIEPYIGHGGVEGVVVRGRVLDDPPLAEAVEGEGARASLLRTLRRFMTDELPGVPLRVTVADATAETVTDSEGYFLALLHPNPDKLTSPWTRGTVELAGEYRGITDPHTTPLEVRVAGPDASFGILSDIDDTILETGVQRVGQMIRKTLTGSALTRTPFPDAADLYRDLAAGVNPVFYVSSSPWNLHAFLVAFLRHRGFPLGAVLLRDLLGTSAGREQKTGRIQEILDVHPQLPFVLVGDSGEKDPEIYADIVQAHPGRILAVYIREVRMDPGDGRVEKVSDSWAHDVPFVIAADTDAVRRHAAELGLF